MKKMLLIVLLMLMFVLSSCSGGKSDMRIGEANYEETADKTIAEIISAVRIADEAKLIALFPYALQTELNDEQTVTHFIEFVRGDVVSVSSASESGVGVDTVYENRKKRTEIQSAFSIETTETKYYIAIKECVANEFEQDHIGILSIYIIKANDWSESYVYRGDGKWTPGINIDVPTSE